MQNNFNGVKLAGEIIFISLTPLLQLNGTALRMYTQYTCTKLEGLICHLYVDLRLLQ